MKRIKKAILLLWLTMSTGMAYAGLQGQAKIDSMLSELTKQKEDTNKVKLLNDISIAYLDVNPRDAIKYLEMEMALAVRLDYKKGIGSAYNYIGHYYFDQGNYNEALKNYSAALKIRQAVGDKKGMGGAYCNIGNAYACLNNFSETLNSYFAALKILEEIGDKPFMARTLNNIGIIYKNQNKYEEALKYSNKALEIKEEIKDMNGIASSRCNIALLYSSLGKYAEALKSEEMALKIYEQNGNKNGLLACYQGIGTILTQKGDLPGALKSLFTGLKISEEIGNSSKSAHCCQSIGEVLYRQKKYKLAEEYVRRGMNTEAQAGEVGRMKSAYELLSNIYEQTGQYEKALKNYRAFTMCKDTIFNKENSKKLVESQMQYDFDKKESLARTEQEKKDAIAGKEIQRQKMVRNGFVGSFAIVLLFAGIFLRQRNHIQKGKERSDELLLNILPFEVAEELKLKGHADARHFDDVTVMFTDFVGFTLVSEKLTSQQLVNELNECFLGFDEIISKYRIEKIKTIGDAFLAVSGLPKANPNHAEDMVRAAIEIRDFIEKRNISRNASNNYEGLSAIRIGIHSGEVVAGIIGVKKFAYDIWGDTVNTAARMEQNSEAGKINISHTTYELVKDKITCKYRGEIEAKNKGGMKMYYVG